MSQASRNGDRTYFRAIQKIVELFGPLSDTDDLVIHSMTQK